MTPGPTCTHIATEIHRLYGGRSYYAILLQFHMRIPGSIRHECNINTHHQNNADEVREKIYSSAPVRCSDDARPPSNLA